jgi:hypothetical protein
MKAQQMTCKRALLVLVGEATDGTHDQLLAARLHASRCPRCSAAYDPALPDVVALNAPAGPRTELATPLRVGLFTIAAAQLVLAIPWLVGRSLLPDSDVAVSHLTRDGALGLVIATLALVTVWRPRYVHSTRLIGLIVLGLQLITGVADQQMSSVSASFELVHFLVVIIVLGLFAAAADLARRATPLARPQPRVLGMRLTSRTRT